MVFFVLDKLLANDNQPRGTEYFGGIAIRIGNRCPSKHAS